MEKEKIDRESDGEGRGTGMGQMPPPMEPMSPRNQINPSKSAPTVRSKFPETWIWADMALQ